MALVNAGSWKTKEGQGVPKNSIGPEFECLSHHRHISYGHVLSLDQIHHSGSPFSGR